MMRYICNKTWLQICIYEQQLLILRYKIKRTLKSYHIKVDWETLQIIMKCRDKLSYPMAGPSYLSIEL